MVRTKAASDSLVTALRARAYTMAMPVKLEGHHTVTQPCCLQAKHGPLPLDACASCCCCGHTCITTDEVACNHGCCRW
jgi:hypothetical protein